MKRPEHNSHQQIVYPKDLPVWGTPVSLMVGNFNHSKMVRRFVENIFLSQPIGSREYYEIVVADSGSDAENIAEIKKLMQEFRGVFPFQFVYVDKTEDRCRIPGFHGFSFCVNAGARVANNDILIYCDSSIIVPPYFLAEMTMPHCGGLNGFLKAPLVNLHSEPDFDHRDIQYYQKIKEKYQLINSHGRPAWSVKKASFIALGGMDEEMTRYSVVDDDFVCRFIMAGGGNWISESEVIHIYHPEPRDDSGGYNAQIMEHHIQTGQVVVNQGKNWGEYTWRESNE